MKELVTVESVFIKLKSGKRYKSVIFIRNGKRESILIDVSNDVKEGSVIEYAYLLNLSNTIT